MCTGETGKEITAAAACGDDIVQVYTYQEAATATSSLWTLKPTDSTTALHDQQEPRHRPLGSAHGQRQRDERPCHRGHVADVGKKSLRRAVSCKGWDDAADSSGTGDCPGTAPRNAGTPGLMRYNKDDGDNSGLRCDGRLVEPFPRALAPLPSTSSPMAQYDITTYINMALGITDPGPAFNTGFYNVVIGEGSGAALTTGDGNTTLGYRALHEDRRRAGQNTAIGWRGGRNRGRERRQLQYRCGFLCACFVGPPAAATRLSVIMQVLSTTIGSEQYPHRRRSPRNGGRHQQLPQHRRPHHGRHDAFRRHGHRHQHHGPHPRAQRHPGAGARVRQAIPAASATRRTPRRGFYGCNGTRRGACLAAAAPAKIDDLSDARYDTVSDFSNSDPGAEKSSSRRARRATSSSGRPPGRRRATARPRPTTTRRSATSRLPLLTSQAATTPPPSATRALYSEHQRVIENTAIGTQALQFGSASDNTAVGAFAISLAVPGNYNTAVGSYALEHCNGCAGETAVGYQSMLGLTTGAGNTAYGYQTLQALTINNDNTAYGYQALFHDNDSVTAANASNNTAIGYQSLYANVPGSNTAPPPAPAPLSPPRSATSRLSDTTPSRRIRQARRIPPWGGAPPCGQHRQHEQHGLRL